LAEGLRLEVDPLCRRSTISLCVSGGVSLMRLSASFMRSMMASSSCSFCWFLDFAMDAVAVAQARVSLVKAEKSLASLKAATKIEDAEEAWTDFLMATSRIYAKLEQGSKANGGSQGWFGRKKKERKDDELLRYLHFARNSDEHGIERVAATSGDNFGLDGRKRRFNERQPYKAQMLDQVTQEPVGETVDVVIAGPTLKPIRVTDSRFGDFCDPPKTHRGKPIR
jgi:hypothetical protein